MHLHGFYFEVESLGDGVRDQPVAAADRHPVVTQLLRSGRDDDDDVDAGARRQLALPLPHHASRVAGAAAVGAAPQPRRAITTPAHGHDASAGMAGMIMGVTVVRDPAAAPASARATNAARRAS